MIIIECPKCKKLLEVTETKLGKKEVCEHCENIFVVDDTVIYKSTQQQTTSPQQEGKQQTATKTNEQTKQEKPKKRSLSIGRIIIGVFVGIIAIGLVIRIVNSFNRGLKEVGFEGILPSKTYSITNESFKLEAGQFWSVSFNSVKGAKLVGSVSVPSYDVNVWLIHGSNNLNAFKNHEEFSYVVGGSAEKVNRLRIECRLDEGPYHLIIDNTYSILNSKNPTVNLSLEY